MFYILIILLITMYHKYTNNMGYLQIDNPVRCVRYSPIKLFSITYQAKQNYDHFWTPPLDLGVYIDKNNQKVSNDLSSLHNVTFQYLVVLYYDNIINHHLSVNIHEKFQMTCYEDLLTNRKYYTVNYFILSKFNGQLKINHGVINNN